MTLTRHQVPPTGQGARRRWSLIAAALFTLALTTSMTLLSMRSAAAATATLWGWSTPANSYEARDGEAVELGTRFVAKSAGSATGVRFYKAPGNTGTHTGTLWSARGERLATARFAQETASGWQTVKFATPVPLEAGQTYTASYYAPQGHYSITERFGGQSLSSRLEAAGGVFRYGSQSSYPTQTWHSSQYWVDVTFETGSTPSPTPTATPTATTTPRPSATPTATTTPTPTATTSTAPASGGLIVLGRSFPSASTTGVPAGTSLTKYTGPCTITAANTTIDAKQVDCSLRISAKNVKITRSQINGAVYGGSSGSFTISDSEVVLGNQDGTGISEANFTAIRVEVTGGARSINCFRDCTVEASYVHGQYRDASGQAHESGIRMGSNSVIRGNTIACTAPEVPPSAGCSAALTGYGDFAVVENNTIDGNYFMAGSGGYCAYGGSSTGKPYSNGVNNVKFTNNVWERGKSGVCGIWGPIVSFDRNAPGNVWTGNVFDDGKTITP